MDTRIVTAYPKTRLRKFLIKEQNKNKMQIGSGKERSRMNIPSENWYRLVARGGAGLACDKDGVALGAVDLVRARLDARRVRRCDVRSLDETGRVLRTAYGRQPAEVVQRVHRGPHRAARWIEAGDLCGAGIEAVMLGFPDLTVGAMAKLAEIGDLEKAVGPWETEPRIPRQQTGGGEWTTDGGGAPQAVKPARALPLDDGVDRPGVDHPSVISVGGTEESDEPRRGSNGPPDDFTTLLEVFPGFKGNPGLATPLEPIDGFLGISGAANEANLEATMGQYYALVAQIKAIDPSFVDNELLPPEGIAGLSWQGRNNLINHLRMERAVAFYKLRGDAGPLQVETLRFLQQAVDDAYADGEKEFDAGKLKSHLSREEAIGNYVDKSVRSMLCREFSAYDLPYGPGWNITINNRDYDTSSPQRTWTVPDARIGNISFDWTLTPKTISNEQVRGFFAADAQPIGVVIVRPAQIGVNNTYLIPRPAELRPRR
jgi:hypothetical protein